MLIAYCNCLKLDLLHKQVCEANTKLAKDPDNSENEGASNLDLIGNTENKSCQVIDSQVVGIATGNWGCGAFGGDPGIKCMIQWLAASQVFSL